MFGIGLKVFFQKRSGFLAYPWERCLEGASWSGFSSGTGFFMTREQTYTFLLPHSR